jgi:hypothetical protein
MIAKYDKIDTRRIHRVDHLLAGYSGTIRPHVVKDRRADEISCQQQQDITIFPAQPLFEGSYPGHSPDAAIVEPGYFIDIIHLQKIYFEFRFLIPGSNPG